jgi:hypothetical protein
VASLLVGQLAVPNVDLEASPQPLLPAVAIFSLSVKRET